MYVGRFVVVGPRFGAYRVSSRSFPNREIRDRGGVLTVGPTADAPETDNPYVSYNCLRVVTAPTGEQEAVVGNGSHVDPVAEKVERGYPARDALVEALHALDYEKDDYDTPRIAGVVGPAASYVGIVRRDALLVEAVEEPTLVATYETDAPETFDLSAGAGDDPETVARAMYDLEFEHPVCAAAAVRDGDGFATGFYNGE